METGTRYRTKGLVMGPNEEDVEMFVEWLAEDHGVIVSPEQVRPSALTAEKIARRWYRIDVPTKLRAGDIDVTMFTGFPGPSRRDCYLVYVADFGDWRGIVAV